MSLTRRLVVAGLLALALLVFAAPARAVTLKVFPEGSSYVPPLQSYLDTRNNSWLPTAPGDLEVYLRNCPYTSVPAAGCYLDVTPPELWISSSLLTPKKSDALRKVFFHELGHHFDYKLLNAEERLEFTRMFGFAEGTPWAAGVGELAPREWFAEAASSCWYGPNRPYSTYRWPFTYQEALPACLAMRAAYDDSSKGWYGYRLMKATWRKVPVRARGSITGNAPWGGDGYRTNVTYKYTTLSMDGCYKMFRFGKQGQVSVDLCGSGLKVRSTLPGTAYVRYAGIPSQPGAAPRSRVPATWDTADISLLAVD